MKLHIDFETFSACELGAAGLCNYARHTTTGVWCAAFAFDDEPVELWTPRDPVPTRIVEYIQSGGLVYAHNVAFEAAMLAGPLAWYGWPDLPLEQRRCTMAMSYAMALPGSLERAAAAVGLEHQKDQAGRRVMLQLCRPRSTREDGAPVFWSQEDAPEKFDRLYAYCKQDVETERALTRRLLELTDEEARVFRLDAEINDRGVALDGLSIAAAIDLVDAEKARLDGAMREATDGAVASCQAVAQLKDWLNAQGMDADGVARADVSEMLEAKVPLPNGVREVLELRREAAKSSTAKLAAMRDRVSPDGRARGLFSYHRASTGRFGSWCIQVQNLPRGELHLDAATTDQLLEQLRCQRAGMAPLLRDFYGSAMQVVSDCLRGLLVSGPGKQLIACDYSAIEARVLAWLTEDVNLARFRAGGKVYEAAAAEIYRIPVAQVTKDQRFIGKTATLSLGYQGGKRALQKQAANGGVKLSDSAADVIKDAWRTAHPRIVRFWRAIGNAAMDAVRLKGRPVQVGVPSREIRFRVSGSFLFCRLPSSRTLCYPYPKVETVEAPFGTVDGMTYMAVDGTSGKWERTSGYGGRLTENVVQAIARDLLVDAMLRIEAAGHSVVLHVHDEIVVEVDPTVETTTIEQIILDAPAWSRGLPLAVESWAGKRYRK